MDEAGGLNAHVIAREIGRRINDRVNDHTQSKSREQKGTIRACTRETVLKGRTQRERTRTTTRRKCIERKLCADNARHETRKVLACGLFDWAKSGWAECGVNIDAHAHGFLNLTLLMMMMV